MPSANHYALSRQNRLGQRPLIFRKSSAFENSYLVDSIPVSDQHYLYDHRVAGKVIYPAAGFCMAGIAVNQAMRVPADKHKPMALKNIKFRRSLSLSGDDTAVLRLNYKPARSEFTVFSSRNDDLEKAIPHAAGLITDANPEQAAFDIDLDALFKKCVETIDVSYFYRRLRQSGLDYGPFFRGIALARASRDTGEAVTRISSNPGLTITGKMQARTIASLDCAFQSLAATLDSDHFNLHVPSRIETLRVFADLETNLWCYARLTNSTNRAIVGDITIFNSVKRPLMAIRGLRCLKIKRRHLAHGTADIASWNKPLSQSNNFQQQLSPAKSGQCNVEY